MQWLSLQDFQLIESGTKFCIKEVFKIFNWGIIFTFAPHYLDVIFFYEISRFIVKLDKDRRPRILWGVHFRHHIRFLSIITCSINSQSKSQLSFNDKKGELLLINIRSLFGLFIENKRSEVHIFLLFNCIEQ